MGLVPYDSSATASSGPPHPDHRESSHDVSRKTSVPFEEDLGSDNPAGRANSYPMEQIAFGSLPSTIRTTAPSNRSATQSCEPRAESVERRRQPAPQNKPLADISL